MYQRSEYARFNKPKPGFLKLQDERTNAQSRALPISDTCIHGPVDGKIEERVARGGEVRVCAEEQYIITV